MGNVLNYLPSDFFFHVLCFYQPPLFLSTAEDKKPSFNLLPSAGISSTYQTARKKRGNSCFRNKIVKINGRSYWFLLLCRMEVGGLTLAETDSMELVRKKGHISCTLMLKEKSKFLIWVQQYYWSPGFKTYSVTSLYLKNGTHTEIRRLYYKTLCRSLNMMLIVS